MFDVIRTHTLRLLRVPHDPDPPAGAPGSVRVFRAGANFYRLRLVGWAVAQVGALLGIAVSLTFLVNLQQGVSEARTRAREERAAKAAAPKLLISPPSSAQPPVDPRVERPRETSNQKDSKTKVRRNVTDRARSSLGDFAERWPGWIFPLVTVLEFAGIALYLIQIPFTYALARLDYELRWYIVTDRSLRIRAGLTSVQETTMSFANVQQVAVSQGPLQRLLGIADVRVQSAGGGGGDHDEHGGGSSLHTGIFHGVDNASEIRDLILERLRLFRQTGLGDPDEPSSAGSTLATPSQPAPADVAVTAAQELLQEARALRRAIG
jgi:hypothetical protein